MDSRKESPGSAGVDQQPPTPVGGTGGTRANDVQIAGDHYRKYGEFQPWDAFYRWDLNPFASHIIPYLVRWKDKPINGHPAGSSSARLEHLHKARHFLDKWIEEETRVGAGEAAAEKYSSCAKMLAEWDDEPVYSAHTRAEINHTKYPK